MDSITGVFAHRFVSLLRDNNGAQLELIVTNQLLKRKLMIDSNVDQNLEVHDSPSPAEACLGRANGPHIGF
jgi:hypothetical protein